MEKYCLTKSELSRFFETQFSFPEELDSSDITALYSQWECWYLELICLATTVAEVLEHRQKTGLDVHGALLDIYRLSDRIGLFTVESFDHAFIDYMFRCTRNSNISIEENLREIRADLNEYKF